MKRWNIPEPVQSASTLALSVLAGRGIKTPEEADSFLHEGEISDPFLIKDMQKGAEIIKASLYAGEKIVIFGDYDCDGVTSTVMLYQYLSAQGGEVDYYIPSREEGFGLNTEALETIIEDGAKLIITVDNGISCIEEAAFIKENGVKLVITDHHTAPEALPLADAIINPKRPDDDSPFKELAGCGVVLKLIMALENDIESVLEQFGDLAALGTIGDVVPLIRENRVIVRQGLQIMPFTENVGLYKLLRQCGVIEDGEDNSDRLTAHSLAYTACPRINAAGRFAHAKKAAELLLCEDENAAGVYAHELSELNNARRETEDKILEQIEEMFTNEPERLAEKILVIKGENWHLGVIGIISSRILTRWGKPNIIISDDGEELRGSARSTEGFPLVPLLEYCAEKLEKFGGHVKAAGFSAKSENFEALSSMIKEYTDKNVKDSFSVRDAISIDKVLEPRDLSLENVEGLSTLMPFGEANPQPVFLMQNCVILSKKPLKDGKYLTFNVRLGGEQGIIQKILCFSSTYADFPYDIGNDVDILVTLSINDYNNTRSISAQLKDIRPAKLKQERFFAALDAYEAIVRGEEIAPPLAVRVLPETEDIKIVYDILRRHNQPKLSVDRVYAEAYAKGLNYCKFRIILDVLREAGLIHHDIIHNTAGLLPASAKADLEASPTLIKARKLAGVKV